MDQCSQSTLDRRRWWSWQDTVQSDRLWSTMLRSLETERSLPYSMISTKKMVKKWLFVCFTGPFLSLSWQTNRFCFQAYYFPMVTRGKKWGVLLYLHWEILGWAKGLVRRESSKNVVTWLKNLSNTKVRISPLKHCIQHSLEWSHSYYPTLFLLGKAFDNAQTINYAASNIISAIMFGKRFEYKDPVFQAMVERDHESIRLTGTASILVHRLISDWVTSNNYKEILHCCAYYRLVWL